jgi:hypothetical protein
MFFASLVNYQALFLEPYHFVRSIKANPLKDGDAKPWVYILQSILEALSGTREQ